MVFHVLYMEIPAKKRCPMINISGHLRNIRRAIGFEDTEHPLAVNCCGYQKFMTRDFSQQRTIGRLDYQIIYIFKGCGHFLLKDQWTTLASGHILLFRPGEPQIYSYFAADEPEIYWIHFTGTACEKLIEEYQLRSGFIGENLSLKLLFQEIILELQLKKTKYETMVLFDLMKIFALISRTYTDQDSGLENDFSIGRLVMALHRNYADNWTLDTMAEYCGLSQSHFSHAFKKRMGVSPIQFLCDIRIEKAEELLASGSLSVSAIAKLVGFEDALYFSKFFRKRVGVSPREFLRNSLEENSPDKPGTAQEHP